MYTKCDANISNTIRVGVFYGGSEGLVCSIFTLIELVRMTTDVCSLYRKCQISLSSEVTSLVSSLSPVSASACNFIKLYFKLLKSLNYRL